MSSKARFSIIPGWIVTDSRLRGKDLQILCLLGRHTDKEGWCRRSQVKMAGELSCARSTVHDALNRLIEIGAVERHVVSVDNGRDTAHFYRVIYDRPVSDSYALEADLTDDDLENYSNTPVDEAAPPAGIPAPPAGPEPAPPAGPEPAPINDPLITPLSKGNGGRGRDGQEEKNISAFVSGQEPQTSRRADREKVERQFQQWLKTWPGVGNLDFARNAWQALSADQRTACINQTPAYLSWADRKITAPAVYLKNRAWEDMPEDAGEAARTHALAGFCGKLWVGRWFQVVLSPPEVSPLTKSESAMIERGHMTREAVLLGKRLQNGWPEANRMLDLARECKGVSVSLALKPFVADFQSVGRDTDLFKAWKRLHERRGWPQIKRPMPNIWLPAVDADAVDLDAAVEVALANFEQAISEGRENDAA
ncbi:hypothetical protein FB480_103441 [Agrobacterium vitis]|nr:hypothetical protein FB480_103441 [Agrobacterium vitis]